jgi:hypothetical protein
MNLLMIILNYGGHVKPLYTRCASAKGGLVRLQGAPSRCLCHTLTVRRFIHLLLTYPHEHREEISKFTELAAPKRHLKLSTEYCDSRYHLSSPLIFEEQVMVLLYLVI